jgi:predicted ATPase/DNA-binding XRE family transcriptional regulator/tetratricopeptide (TPR) repeat protein
MSPGVGFAGILRRQRLTAGLTQEELAARAGLGVRTVRELERGRVVRPQRGTVTLLADALELVGDARETFIAASTARRQPPTRTAPLPPRPDLVGRDRDVNELLELLEHTEQISLVGLAGVGKTSLAVAVAHRYATGGREAVAVSVSSVAGRADILAAVAAVFGVHRAEELSRREALLIVDGVDRSPAAAREAIQWLRTRAPGLKLLATSLTSVGGVDWRVEPLDVPPESVAELKELAEYPAVALFLQRLRQVRRDAVRDDEAAALAVLVRRLCGLPLALELAAARGRILEVPELLDRYGDRVLDLGQGDPVPWRIRDAVAATYRLLAPDEQHVLRRLSTFQGRWSLELAEALLDDRPGTDVEVILDRLVGLGLVSVRGPGELRFRLLDVVADFAAEQAANTGEQPAARAQHAAVVARVVVRIAADLATPDILTAVDRLDALNADVRAALRFAEARDPVTALRIGAAIPRWLRFRGRDIEGRRMIRALLDDPRTAGAEPTLRAWAQVGAALLAGAHGAGPAELAATERALATFVEHHDAAGELAARSVLGALWQAIGGSAQVRRHAEAIIAVALRTDRMRELAIGQNRLAWDDVRTGDLAVAATRLAAAAQRATEAGDLRILALVQANQAELARRDGRLRDAIDQARRTLPSLSQLGDPRHRVRLLGTLGQALAESGAIQDLPDVLDELASSTPGAAGVRALIEGYLALHSGDRAAAEAAFRAAANGLAGGDDARDVLEALVGVAASATDARRRADALAELSGLCERTGLALLPRDRAMLG